MDKSSTSFGWDYGGEVASVGWRVIPCDPIDMRIPVAVRWVSLTAIPAIIIIIIIIITQSILNRFKRVLYIHGWHGKAFQPL